MRATARSKRPFVQGGLCVATSLHPPAWHEAGSGFTSGKGSSPGAVTWDIKYIEPSVKTPSTDGKAPPTTTRPPKTSAHHPGRESESNTKQSKFSGPGPNHRPTTPHALDLRLPVRPRSRRSAPELARHEARTLKQHNAKFWWQFESGSRPV